MYQILSTNIEEVSSTKELQSKTDEISVAIKLEDIGKPSPKLYAFRYGMAYDPENDFKPNVPPNHKIDVKLQRAFFKQEDKAMQAYRELLNKIKTSVPSVPSVPTEKKDNSSELEKIKELEKMIEQKNARIKEQTDKIAELSSKTSEEIVHELFEDICNLVKENEPIYLYGPAGTGKSELAKQISKALNLDFYPASTVTQEFKLSGYKDANGLYQDTNFYKAFKLGGLFFLDELDSCAEQVLVGINGALANGYYDFPNGVVYAHPDFRVISAGNTIGRGATDGYTGRSTLDISTIDRFLAIEFDYSPIIDLHVSRNDEALVQFAHAVRDASKKSGILILCSYRSISKIAKLQGMNFDLERILKMALIKGLASDDVQMLTRNMEIPSTNKYYKALKKVA